MSVSGSEKKKVFFSSIDNSVVAIKMCVKIMYVKFPSTSLLITGFCKTFLCQKINCTRKRIKNSSFGGIQ